MVDKKKQPSNAVEKPSNAVEILSDAVEKLGSGDFAGAIEACDSALEADPESGKAWHLKGIAQAQTGDLDQARSCFENATKLRGDVASYHYNLGLACHGLGDLDAATEAYEAAVKINPALIEAQNNLGNCYLENGLLFKSIEHFRSIAEQFPDESIVQYNLGNVLQDNGESEEAIAALRRATELDPSFSSAWDNLGRALNDEDRHDEALDVWKQWLAHEPDNAVAKHMLAALGGDHTPKRCNDEYVRNTFDKTFAHSYENQLDCLRYKVPELIEAALDESQTATAGLITLDAGCGTGLCADLLRPRSKRLVGVDLSADMLAKADGRDVYDELCEQELTAFLQSHADEFDLIVCGDTLCYFGELAEVVAGFATSIKRGGHVAFTVEAIKRDDSEATEQEFELQPNGRYRHQESYLRDVARKAGLSVINLSTGVIRTERGRDVDGFVVVLESEQ